MKRIRKLLACVLLSLSSFIGTTTSATGIPTVDIAALVQELISYSQQVTDYTEQLYQSQVSANEYIQKLQQLEQIYREYEHTLDQIEGLQDYVEQDVWEDILNIVDITFPSLPLDDRWSEWSAEILQDEKVAEVDAKVSTQHNRMRELEEIYDDIDAAFSSADLRQKKKEDARKLYHKSRQTTEQKYSETVFKEQSEQLGAALKDVKKTRSLNATGNQSQLRTLQTMAMQLELELEYQKSQNEILLKTLELSNQEIIERKNRQSYTYDAQLRDQLEQANREPYQATDRKKTVNF